MKMIDGQMIDQSGYDESDNPSNGWRRPEPPMARSERIDKEVDAAVFDIFDLDGMREADPDQLMASAVRTIIRRAISIVESLPVTAIVTKAVGCDRKERANDQAQ